MAATLNARLRKRTGKGHARTLRRAGEVPAVMYGHGDETETLALDTHEVERLLASISVENTLVDLSVEGRKGTQSVLIREVQWHPFRPLILHVDLYRIHAGEAIWVDVPVILTGRPLGVREEGGVLQHVRHELEVKCLPKDIPPKIEIDVTELSIGDSIHVRDLDVPNVEIVADEDLTLCTVVAPTLVEVEEPEEEVEPELVGAEAEEGAEAEAAAEAGEAGEKEGEEPTGS